MTPRTSTDGVTESGSPVSTALGSAKYSTIEFFDRQTDLLLFKVTYAMFSAQEWRVTVKDVMMGTVSFQGVAVTHTSNSDTTGALF
jgi:hypothetical protein